MLLPLGAAAQIVLMSQIDDRTRTQAIVVLDPARYWETPSRCSWRACSMPPTSTWPAWPRSWWSPARTHVRRRAAVAHAIADPGRDIRAVLDGQRTLVGSLQVVAGVMRDLGWSAATVVTDPAHAARAQATASHSASTRTCSTEVGGMPTSEYVGRETLALLRHHLVTRWVSPAAVRRPLNPSSRQR